MLRKLLSRLLRLDLQSQIHWSDTETMAVISRISFEQLQPGRTETIDLVLCRSGDDYVLYKKWRRSGDLIRIRFSQRLEGKEMRLKQMTPPPNLLYRLFLQPVGGTPVEYAEANPLWFGFWRNESSTEESNWGSCFVESSDRNLLEDLRCRLLDGQVPDSLREEEEQERQFQSLSEEEQKVALAKRLMKLHAEAMRQFEQLHPNLGPPPDALKPAFDAMQERLKEISRTASSDSPLPEEE